MDSPEVYAVSLDDYLITAEVLDDAISIAVELEHEVVLNLFEYPAEITVLAAKITEVEEISTATKETAESAATTATTAKSTADMAKSTADTAKSVAEGASSAATVADGKAVAAQSSADAAMSQAEAATDMAASNSLSISNILTNLAAWVRSTLLTGLPAFTDVTVAVTDSFIEGFAKLQGQVNAIKARIGILENRVIADITTTTLLTTIDITGLNFVDGDVFTVDIMGQSSAANAAVVLSLNNIKTAQYWYSGTVAYTGFLGLAWYYYRNKWTVSVNNFNCICRVDHNRGDATGSNYVQVTVTTMTKPVPLGGTVVPPITMISITTSTNGIAIGTRIIVKKV